MSSNGWRKATMREISVGIYDGPHATPKKTDTGPIFLGISSLNGGRLNLSETAHIGEEDFSRWTKRVTPQPDDVVFSYETRIGEVAIVPKGLRCCLGRRMALIRPDTNVIEPRFLLYWYLSPEFQDFIRSRTVHGSTVDRILLTEFPDYPIRFPSLAEQKRIVEILGSLDDKIELNRKMNETLEEMARAIFKSWFVDFDPVRAKMDGKKSVGMDDETAALFPDELVHVNGELVPKGWDWLSLPEIMDINPKRTISKGAIAPYLDMKNVPTQGHRVGQVINREFKSGTKFLQGDTLLARITPCLENGKTAFVDFLKDAQVGWGSTEFIVLRPRNEFPTFYAYLLARDPEFRLFAIQNMTGTSGRQRVPSDCFTRYMLAKPTTSLLSAFSEVCAPFFEKIKANSLESKTLASLRDTLLPKLLSGEIQLAQAEQLAEAVV